MAERGGWRLPRELLFAATAILAYLAAAKVLVHLLTVGNYGYFRDELYYVTAEERLQVGYVEFPPFVALAATGGDRGRRRGDAGVEIETREAAELPQNFADRFGWTESAATVVVERHHAELYRYARALLRDTPAAEDAVQEVFERAFVALGKYPEEWIMALSLRPWMYRIVLNVVRNTWRAGRREVSVAEMPERADGGFASPAGSAPGADREVWMDALDTLGRLSERQRVAVALRYLEDLPYAGIPEATSWPENTCKTLVRRGIERLAVLLSKGSYKKRNGGS